MLHGKALNRIHLGLILQELSDCSESDDGYSDNTNDEQLAKRVTQVGLYHDTGVCKLTHWENRFSQ